MQNDDWMASGQQVFRGVNELEREIVRRCAFCAGAVAVEARRDQGGSILWLHHFDGGTAASCEAADLQPWREVARRTERNLEAIRRGLTVQDELDRWAAAE